MSPFNNTFFYCHRLLITKGEMVQCLPLSVSQTAKQNFTSHLWVWLKENYSAAYSQAIVHSANDHFSYWTVTEMFCESMCFSTREVLYW